MLKKEKIFNTRFGFLSLLILLITVKTIFAYYFEFNLGLADPLQHLIAIFNPIPTGILLISLAFYINKDRFSYIFMFFMYFVENLLLYSNILYYREFTDFISFNSIASVSKVSKGLGSSTISMMKLHDFIYWIDFLILIYFLIRGIIKLDKRPIKRITAFATTIFSIALFTFNLAIAESNRPQLLGRTFDKTYIVKYLGLNSFLFYDTLKTAQNDAVRSSTDGNAITPVLDYVEGHYAEPNKDFFGKANGKNIIVIHLESFQQFLIDFSYNNQEVTPFLNSLYHDKSTLGFENFFHEVGAGRTSDAETMLENSLFGLPEGSLFPKLGPTNTFQAAPAILNQKKGYTSAVFHGNVASFWSRNVVYKNFGYNYFFDESYFDDTAEDSTTKWGIKDKLLLSQSVKYLEQMQQPFYTKFITVTNHYSFPLSDEDNGDFIRPETDDSIVNNYFATAHYLDQSIKEFFDYLKKSGLYDNSMIVLYGDHYGLSPDNNKSLAELLNKDPNNWTDFDETQMQKVPFMIHMPGLDGGIQKQYGGEIDVLPTILHLAGVNTKNYIQFGTDLLSPQHNQNVIFRNKDFINEKYTVINTKSGKREIYDNKTGLLIEHPNEVIQDEIDKIQKDRDLALQFSDQVNKMNLLRFYTPKGFIPVNPEDFNYLNQMEQMTELRDKLGDKSTSLYSRNKGESTTYDYLTDAPQLKDDRSSIDTYTPK